MLWIEKSRISIDLFVKLKSEFEKAPKKLSKYFEWKYLEKFNFHPGTKLENENMSLPKSQNRKILDEMFQNSSRRLPSAKKNRKKA